LNRVSPWTKLAALLIFIFAVTISQNLLILLLIYLLSVLVYAAGRLPLRRLIRWYLLPVIYTLTIALLFVFDEPAEGIMLIASLLLRALAVVTYSLALVLTTKYSEVTALADRTLPRPFDTIFLLTYHFIFVFFELMDRILVASWARGGSLTSGIRNQGSLYAKIFAYGIVFSFDKAERVGKAMEARGFRGSLVSHEAIKRPSIGGVFILTVSAAIIIMIYYYQVLMPWP
jgi:cobalt/nickel transport system permease protein